MIVGLGVDLFDVARMEAELLRADPAFTRQIFTRAEIADCDRQRHPAQHYAARFAAKEAVVKALCLEGAAVVPWTDIDVRDEPRGHWQVVLRGDASQQAERLGVARILLSAAQARGVAVASVVLESTP